MYDDPRSDDEIRAALVADAETFEPEAAPADTKKLLLDGFTKAVDALGQQQGNIEQLQAIREAEAALPYLDRASAGELAYELESTASAHQQDFIEKWAERDPGGAWGFASDRYEELADAREAEEARQAEAYHAEQQEKLQAAMGRFQEMAEQSPGLVDLAVPLGVRRVLANPEEAGSGDFAQTVFRQADHLQAAHDEWVAQQSILLGEGPDENGKWNQSRINHIRAFSPPAPSGEPDTRGYVRRPDADALIASAERIGPAPTHAEIESQFHGILNQRSPFDLNPLPDWQPKKMEPSTDAKDLEMALSDGRMQAWAQGGMPMWAEEELKRQGK